jgi:hypothetical protein
MRMPKSQAFLLLLVCLSLGFNLIIPFFDRKSVAEAAWWDASWTKLKVVSISNPVANYQMTLNVTYDGDMQADFDDLRFTDSDNTTALPYWIETKVNSAYALLWVKLHDTDTSINMYYGNAGASATSNGTATWDYFLDWSTNKSSLFTKYYKTNSVDSIRYTSLGLHFNLTATNGYRLLYDVTNTWRNLGNYGTGCGLLLLDSTGQSKRESAGCIGTMFYVDGRVTQKTYFSHFGYTAVNYYSTGDNASYLYPVAVKHTFNVVTTSTLSNSKCTLGSSQGTQKMLMSLTKNISKHNMTTLGYDSAYQQTGTGGVDYWVYKSANGSIQYGAYYPGRTGQLRNENKWVAIGKYQATEPVGTFGAEQSPPASRAWATKGSGWNRFGNGAWSTQQGWNIFANTAAWSTLPPWVQSEHHPETTVNKAYQGASDTIHTPGSTEFFTADYTDVRYINDNKAFDKYSDDYAYFSTWYNLTVNETPLKTVNIVWYGYALDMDENYNWNSSGILWLLNRTSGLWENKSFYARHADTNYHYLYANITSGFSDYIVGGKLKFLVENSYPGTWSTQQIDYVHVTTTIGSNGYTTFGNRYSWTSEETGYNTLGNISSWGTKIEGWNTFGNTASWTTKMQGWNTLRNTASFVTKDQGWNSFTNVTTWHQLGMGWNDFLNTVSWKTEQSGWNTFGHSPSWQGPEGWNSFQNISSWMSKASGYNSFNNMVAWQTIQSGFNTFENSVSWKPVQSGYVLFGNSASWSTKSSGWNSFTNTATYQQKQTGWNTFLNHSSYLIIDQGWNTFQSDRSWLPVIDGWNIFGNIASWTTIEGWNTFGNQASYTNIDQGWSTFGNISSNVILYQGWNTFWNQAMWSISEQGWNTFLNHSSYLIIDQGWNTFQSDRSWLPVTDGWNMFKNAEWMNVTDGYNTFGNISSWSILDQGWNTFNNTVNWTNIGQGWNTFGNMIGWNNIVHGWNTFGNISSWTVIEQGWNTFGNTSYMALLDLFPANGSLICPTCYENDTFFYFNVHVDHTNGSLMDIVWSTWNGTVIGAVYNVGNGTYHIVPFESIMPIIYNSSFNYTINVTDGITTISQTLVFATDTFLHCSQSTLDATQFGALLCIFFFLFFFTVGYLTKKSSSGLFMFIGAWHLISFGVLAAGWSLVFVPFIIPASIYAMFLGINKFRTIRRESAARGRTIGR